MIIDRFVNPCNLFSVYALLAHETNPLTFLVEIFKGFRYLSGGHLRGSYSPVQDMVSTGD